MAPDMTFCLSPQDGREQELIEVKTTNGSARTPFYLGRERARALPARRPAEWCIYWVHLFAQAPRVFRIVPPDREHGNLRPETWRASF